MEKNTLVKHLGPWWEVLGRPKGMFPYSGAQSTNWTSTQPRQLQYNRQGGLGLYMVN